MKRLIGSIFMVGTVVSAFGQGGFTIVRPADGSKVKETVRILIPKRSVPEKGAYVGVFLDGKFREARGPQSLVPTSSTYKDKYLEYDLDTKALGIPDSEPGKPTKLELVLYVDFNEKPRVVARSSVDVYVGNKASIAVPAEGFKLRYAFQPGTESIYKMDETVSISSITKGQNAMGGRGNEEEVSKHSRRVLYAVDNRYENGDGLIRTQFLTAPGKDYLIETVRGTPEKWEDSQLDAFYMRQSATGRDIWGSLPLYFGIDGTNGAGNTKALIGIEPLPALPEKRVKVGTTWQSHFLQGDFPADKNWYLLDKFTEPLPARGELVSVEWENGHRCAVIRNTIKFGDSTSEGQKLKKSGAKFSDNKVEVDELIWFSLDSQRVLRIKRTESIDLRIDQLSRLNIPGLEGGPSNSGGASGSAPGAGGGAPQGGPAGFSGAGGGGGGKKGGGGAGLGTSGWNIPPSSTINQRGGQGGPPAGFIPPGAGGRPPQGGFGPGGPQFGNGRMGQNQQNGGANANELAFVRVKIETLMTLEK